MLPYVRHLFVADDHDLRGALLSEHTYQTVYQILAPYFYQRFRTSDSFPDKAGAFTCCYDGTLHLSFPTDNRLVSMSPEPLFFFWN